MKIIEKVKNLFECLPFDEDGVRKFKSFIKENPLEKKFFYEKNNQGITFIQELLNMDTPQTMEERHIRVHLLYNFYIDSLTSSLVTQNIISNLREEYVKNIYKEYEAHVSSLVSPPKLNLNEQFQKIKTVLEEAGTKNNAKSNINNILVDYFTDLKSSVNIAQTALLIKVFDNIFSENSKENEVKENAKDIEYSFRDFVEDFLNTSLSATNSISPCMSKLIRQIMNIKEFRDIGILKLTDEKNLHCSIWSDQIALVTLENVVSKYLINNKVKANYESLSAELNKERTPIVRLKFMPKNDKQSANEAEKIKRTKL